VIYVSNGPKERVIATSSGSAEHVGEQVPLEAANHIQPPQKANYNSDPPASGPHYNIAGQAPVAWGYHGGEVAPEYWVHNLEHGGVVILYNCPTDCSDEQSMIRDFIAKAPPDDQFHEVKMVAVGYAVPGHRFALLSWGWREFMDSWDSGTAEHFYEAHVNHGPESVP